MASNTQWPDSLKQWVTSCLTQMSEANKADAQTELRDIIKQSYTDGTMWTRDWSKMKLKSLEPKTFKRKLLDPPQTTTTKKVKKTTFGSKFATLESDDRLQQRAQRFQREHEIERQKQAGLLPTHQYSRHVNQAASSFGGLEDRMEGLTTSSSYGSRGSKGQSRRKWLNSGAGYVEDSTGDSNNGVDWDRFTIVGTSENIFKNYLRLTSEPDPRDIRPYRVLTQTLVELKRRWKQDGNYPWICDQFKSLRQDLTVQRIKNEFTVQVYEIHARMALETGDLVEYNQCQSALRTLYELGIPGKREEFLAYRILYLLHVRNRSDLNRLISTIDAKVKEHPVVKHALDVQRAMATNNYHALFALFMSAPNMGAYVMDHFIQRERLGALRTMTKAYLTLPLTFVAQELAFDNASEAHKFLDASGAAVYSTPKPAGSGPQAKSAASIADTSKILDCKAAFPIVSQVYEDKTRRISIAGAI